ncbi:MAG: DNA alkylation repair protein [Candidatus Heimdallarchaeaceae archaeon]
MGNEVKEFANLVLKRVQETSDENYKKTIEAYTKVKSRFKSLGLRGPIVYKIANETFRELKATGVKDIDQILEYCELLHSFNITELRSIAVIWSFKVKKQFRLEHFSIFEKWLKNYVTGWGSTDHLCTKSLGYILFTYPELLKEVKKWTSSQNQWVRRASAVALIYGLRRKQFLEDTFEIADALLNDQEMYVLKGYGWMLKEASNNFRDEVFNYVMKKKNNMPRTALRYAIEKMPQEMRKEAMS